MPLQQNEILYSVRNLLKQVPYRTTFERENFLFNTQGGPRLLVTLCQDIEFLNLEYSKVSNDWEKEAILAEMNAVNTKIVELQTEIGIDLAKAIEEGEASYWVEELARRSAVEAICQAVTTDNMGQMLKLPAELYEETITKCQSFLNVINKVTRIAERKANLRNVNTESEE